MFLKRKDLLTIRDLDVEEIKLILETASSFEEILTRPIKKVPTLRGKTIVNFFLEPSTRTRSSFELAAKMLSAELINISAKTSAVAKGESLKDTAKTFEAMKIDALVIRHSSSGAPHLLAKFANFSVINAGDGTHEHPTQALLDLFTIKKKLGKISGLKIAIVGDILHSRVARSNILAFNKMGVKVTLVAPPTLIPLDIEALDVEVRYNLNEVIKEVDVVYLLRIQLERQAEALFPSIREYSSLFGLNLERIREIKPNTLIMHPGPINRGIEISAEVAELPNAIIADQVESGISVRMALLYLLLGGKTGGGG